MKIKWFIFLLLSTMTVTQAAPLKARRTAVVAPVSITATIDKVSRRAEIRWHLQYAAKNILRFELQKSTDGQNFFYVTSVAALAKLPGKSYLAEDRNILNGNSYYRLKAIYKSGEERYSSISSIAFPELVPVILPAIAQETLFIWLPADTKITTIKITDISGKVIVADAVKSNEKNFSTISIKNLVPGFYNLMLTTMGKENLHLKFTKKQ